MILVLGGGEARSRVLVRELSLVGIDRVIGWAEVDVLDGWRRLGRSLECVRALGAQAVAELRDATVIDVRAQFEWDAGRIPGARHLFLGDLPDATDDLPRDRPLVVACQGGSRSSIGASLLRARGFNNVINFSGGFAEWQRSGLPVETTQVSPDPR